MDTEQPNLPEPAETTATVLGIDQHIEALLCYLLSWVTGIIFLFIEKENQFVRFHALQSVIVFLALWVAGAVCTRLPGIGWLVAVLLYPAQVLLWIFLMYKAFQNELYKIPVAGDIAYNQIFGRGPGPQGADR